MEPKDLKTNSTFFAASPKRSIHTITLSALHSPVSILQPTSIRSINTNVKLQIKEKTVSHFQLRLCSQHLHNKRWQRASTPSPSTFALPLLALSHILFIIYTYLSAVHYCSLPLSISFPSTALFLLLPTIQLEKNCASDFITKRITTLCLV